MKLYSIPFNAPDGRANTLDIYAHDKADAKARLRAAYFQGNEPEEIVARIEAPSWLERLLK